MAHITRRKRPLSRNSLSHGVGLGTALLTGLMTSTIHAEERSHAPSDTVKLDEVSVEAPQTSGYDSEALSSTKFTQPVSETPRTVRVIDKEVLQDQNATTLTEALKNSPGVGTFYAGENGNTTTGDSVYMRGFDSSGSIFVDGVRDLGAISRDTFTVEQIEVFKGPAGTDYGRTAPSGSINLATKRPRLSEDVSVSVSGGSGNQKRITTDWNQAIGDHTAARLNLMGQENGVPGRDRVENNRWGIAPSVAFGLNTDTRVYFDYLHITQNNTPDGGVSTVGLHGYSSPDPARPSLTDAPKVDSENFYGTRADHDDVDVDMFTTVIEHDLNSHTLVRNTTRWGRTQQDYLLSAAFANDSNFNTPNLNDPSTWTIRRIPNFKNQTNTILTNQTGFITNARTGSVAHTLSYGLEVTREEVETTDMDTVGTFPDVNIYNPQPDAAGFTTRKTGAEGSGTTDTVAAYLFDTLDIGQHWQVTAGLRLDHYNAEFKNSGVCGGRGPACNGSPTGTVVPDVDADVSDTLINWKLGALYKVTPTFNLYTNYAVAAQPPGGDNLQFSSRQSSGDNASFDPQKARTVEAGAKWKLANDRLLLSAAAYRTQVTDLVEEDPVGSGTYRQTGEKRVQGVELSAVGNITDRWNVSAGFTSMDAKVKSGQADAQDGSNDLTYTPEHAFTSWTTYRLPFDLTIGGGARYTGGLKRGSDGAVGTPDHTRGYWVMDAMASYPINHNMDLQLNVYNVFDKDYVASINKSGYRYNPDIPRSALVTLNMRF